ncbi:pyridoxamine 5'-phosphate oxidase family protein [Brevibacterium sp. 5221]|uniref:Pyridoxamine 5'-phosphate oxidase family protein n=1 Tax=Brevibacterium rongguiense TaxID=2695267 RepID=A0A6N9H4M4_9MICO|nr:pyridoxamine 5'-phosphate oxidase family protein [Brevibacterium rongguiense]MYM18885.1 pyridoxamine 5'-phosphate oxidase family protein [Brevibacterium rongguiense]
MAETNTLDQADVVDILKRAGYLMLTTAGEGGKLLSHPMSPQQVTDDADVWFFVGLQGDQAVALRKDPHVNLAISEAGNWLSVSGQVQFVDDQAKIDELWNDEAGAYFEGGRQDPNLGLMKVITDSAQHWGMTGGKLSAVAQMVKAKVTGDRPGGGSATTEL